MAENFDVFARFYDLDHGDFGDDLAFYREFAARSGSPVLDVGCGTGRVLLPLARAGLAVTGLDISEAMLARARAHLAAEPEHQARVRLVQGDVRTFCLDERFGLAFMALNSFLHMTNLADQRAALGCMVAHLQPGGLLLLDLFSPQLSQLAMSEGQLLHEWTRRDAETGRTVLKFVTHHTDFAAQVVDVTFLYDETDADGLLRRTVAPFRLRFVSRAEIELLLEAAGFVLEAVYGNYDLSTYMHDSPKLLVVARRP